MDCLSCAYKLHNKANDLLPDYDILDRIFLGSGSHPNDDLSANGHTSVMVKAFQFKAYEVHTNSKRSHVNICLVHVLLF